MIRYRISIVLLVVTAPLIARGANVEEGAATEIPWSGYWWPISKGEIIEPLAKYDQVFTSGAAQWERQNNPPGPNVPEWFGYCHAWSASSVWEKEPKVARSTDGVELGIGDQKGLLAVSHAEDAANIYGTRFNGSEDRHDIAPDVLWRYLKLYLKEKGVPLILDVEAGTEVWNYPVYAYRITYSPQGGGGSQLANLELWMADDAVPPDYEGTKVRYETYSFTFQLQNGVCVMGSGQWVGQSQQMHPDFAWYPYAVIPGNPYLEYEKVKQVVDASGAGGGSSDENVTPPDDDQGGESDDSTIVDPSGSGVSGLQLQNCIPVSPAELVGLIAEKTSSFEFDVTIDKFDGGRYRVGEPIRVTCASEKAGFLYLIYVDSHGEPSLLYPMPGQDNRIAAGARQALASDESGIAPPLIEGPFGTHRIKAVVTTKPLILSGLTCGEQSQVQRSVGTDQSALEKGFLFQRRKFRWCPTQRQSVQSTLVTYQEEQEVPEEQMIGIDIPKILVTFAQDEVAFYVGPTE